MVAPRSLPARLFLHSFLCPLVIPVRGCVPSRASTVDEQDRQHTEPPSHAPNGISSHARGPSNTTAEVFPASERTPLLQPPPPIPRLRDPPGDDVVSAEPIPTSKMFCQEFATLTWYALPVFGYVLSPHFPHLYTELDSLLKKHSNFRILFHGYFRRMHRPHLYNGTGSRYFGFNDGFRHRIQYPGGFRIHTRYPPSSCLDL